MRQVQLGNRHSRFNLHPGWWFDILNGACMVMFVLLILYPFWQVFLLSFSDGREATTLGFHLWPQSWSIEAYQFLLSSGEIIRPYMNSVMRTIIGTALEVLFTILAAYPLAKKELPFRGWLTTYFIIPMFFGGGLIPTYLIIRSLGLLDHFLVLILPGAVAVFSIIIMRNYFMSLDVAIEESAFMDGAGYMTLLFKIILPVSTPVLATIALWAAVGHWNAWFDAMIYIRDRDLTVIQVIMREMLTSVSDVSNDLMFDNNTRQAQLAMNNVRSAIALLSIGPIVLVYPWLQKYFVKGIMLGSVKG
ncbi:carbohydrate ABC transporter permease [Paenibacillus sp. J5C_2022]|uniref:carbohydrate ABC transporter permease n=1 Tax=Paenibacillus sp. J5C2022 TaxID=2977129 RepID=UPI0021D1636D|nr:carbohydrate ABC transporter permease [Paenibacillus sp. J5C2022]MCU6711918.1 carbohydrate ABC transporter permease [Paenibacillus sp. J5C2022]